MGKITRRDFFNGTLMVTGSSLLSVGGNVDQLLAALEPARYPPALTGLRGSHPGSNDDAHRQAWLRDPDWGTIDGTLRLGYGGSQTLVQPENASELVADGRTGSGAGES